MSGCINIPKTVNKTKIKKTANTAHSPPPHLTQTRMKKQQAKKRQDKKFIKCNLFFSHYCGSLAEAKAKAENVRASIFKRQ